MTKAAALHSFFASFGIPAFEENSVPSGDKFPGFPLITYERRTDSFLQEVALTCNVYYRESTWTNCNAMTENISTAIGRGGVLLPCDGGAIWLKRGTPFAQAVDDPADDMIKRNYITLSAEYLTAD